MKRLSLQLVVAVCLSVIVGAAAQSQTPQTSKTSAVADAARRGDRDTVRTLLQQGADASTPQGDGMTALHWAAERGDVALTEMLLYAGANASATTRIGSYTPLHLASRSGSAPVVKALLKAGASAAAKANPSGVTPLHLAAEGGNVAVVTALLDAGADVNATEAEWAQTPLIFAAAANRSEVIKLLVARGAKVNETSKALDVPKQQQTDRQAMTIQRQVLAASVAKGEEPTPSQQQAAIQAIREFYATGKAPEPPAAGAAGAAGGGRGGGRGGAAPPAAGAAPVPAAGAPAPAAGAAPGAQANAAAGGNPFAGGGGRRGAGGAGAAGGAGTNPDTGGGQAGGANALNEDGPAPSIAAKGGLSALHHAARQGNVAAAAALIDGGANVNQKTGDGNSPLLIAVINGEFDVAMMLVKAGANPNQVADGSGVTPLWATVNAQWQPRTRFPQPQEMDLQKATYLDVMKALLDAGADPNARIKTHPWYMVYTGCGNGNCGLASTVGSTAFWRAAYGTDVDGMRLLAKYGADPNIPTMSGGGGGRGGGGGGRGGAAGGRGGAGGGAGANGGTPDGAPAAPPRDPSGLPPVPAGGPAVFPIHAAAGVEYGEGYAGNSHRHAPDGWLPSVKYLVEELGADVNQRDDGGYTPLHHAAARGDNELILYLVSKGADVTALSRRGQTTADMANGPVSRISPIPETIALLEKLGSKNNHKCASCTP